MRAQYTALITALLLASVSSQGNPISTLGEPDNSIVCVGAVPAANVGWPTGLSPDDFADNMDLCAATQQMPRNAGCKCSSPGGAVDCSSANGGDDTLLNTRLRSHAFAGLRYTFKTWCQSKCLCLNAEDGGEFHGQTNEAQDHEVQSSQQTEDPYSRPDAPLPGTLRGYHVTAPPSSVNGTTAADICGESCTSEEDCSTDGECFCATTSSTYEPSSGTLLYSSMCQVGFPSNRDEPVPCPCNSTYVSHACCGETMVWEPEEFKLGELAKEEL
ncbi:MAG: hypothetical protein M1828_006188 [Chrysothrix sp. TS-e1954]|nr:MAG: hypothetical protein M1828_006188 [Chrysothrix sp. TS-e1954]